MNINYWGILSAHSSQSRTVIELRQQYRTKIPMGPLASFKETLISQVTVLCRQSHLVHMSPVPGGSYKAQCFRSPGVGRCTDMWELPLGLSASNSALNSIATPRHRKPNTLLSIMRGDFQLRIFRFSLVVHRFSEILPSHCYSGDHTNMFTRSPAPIRRQKCHRLRGIRNATVHVVCTCPLRTTCSKMTSHVWL